VARVVFKKLSKSFWGSRGEEIRAVSDFTLVVEDHELLVLAGPSGSGKTTLLRLLAGLETPNQGSITIGGKVINDVPPERRDIAMVFQNAALYPHMTVRQNLAFGLKLRKVAPVEVSKRIEHAAETLGLVACLDRLPMQISGGERQRVALGRALVRQPKIFLLDEPLSNLDPQTSLHLRTQIVALHQRLATATIYVTHDQAEAMALGQRIALLRDGKLEQVAAPSEIYQKPANLFVPGFFGSPPINLLRGKFVRERGKLWFETDPSSAARARFALKEGPFLDLVSILGRDIIWGIRPEDISVFRAPVQDSNTTLPATIAQVEFSGGDTLVDLTVAGHHLNARVHSKNLFQIKTEVWIEIVPASGQFFDANSGLSLANCLPMEVIRS